MKRFSSKLKRVLALMLSFVMILSVLTIAPSTNASAAGKYVKSLKLNKKSITLTAGQKNTKVKATVKVVGSAKKTVKIKQTAATKKVVTAKVGKPDKKGASKITLTAKKVTKKQTVTLTIQTKDKGSNKKVKTAKLKVTVKPASTTQEEQVTGVTVTADASSITIGNSTMVRAAWVPATAKTTITWTSSNNAVAVVDQTGRVTGTGAGTADIIGTAANGVTGKCTITVTAVPVENVTLTPATMELPVGQTGKLTAEVSPANATNRQVTWKSSNAEVATVDDTGVVKGIKAGTATITVTTVDGGFTANVVVTVIDSSSSNVDGVKATVTNALEEYSKDTNVVLVGTTANIQITAQKDGQAVGNVDATLTLKGVSGATNKYELANRDVHLDKDGVGTAQIRLKNDFAETRPLIDSVGDSSIAGFSLMVEISGKGLKDTIPVSFAQVLAQTELTIGDEGYALAVDNQHDVELKSITPAVGGVLGTRPMTRSTSVMFDDGLTNKYDFKEEYVVSQQVSNKADEIDNSVVLDAAPVLLIPAAKAGDTSGKYEKTINFDSQEYSVYSDVGNAKVYTLEDVPGGLKKLDLTFTKLSISEHSRIVIRAYEADTDIPILDEDANLVETYVNSDAAIGMGGKSTIALDDVLKKTSNMPKIDLKIFVQSAGQVDQNKNDGFVLASAYGEYDQEKVAEYTTIRLADAVDWTTLDDPRLSQVETMTQNQAQQYLPEVHANSEYSCQWPVAPQVGNAIITEKMAGNKEDAYYLNPLESVDGENSLLTGQRAFIASASETAILSKSDYTATKDSNGRYVIDSTKTGTVHVKATVKVDSMSYDLYSFVQWQTVKEEKAATVDEYYALTGETVTLTAHVTDKNGNDATGTSVEWSAVGGAAALPGAAITRMDETTNASGNATLILQASAAEAVEELSVDAGTNHNVSLTIGGQTVPKEHLVSIYWVQPGIYYLNDVEGGEEYNTALYPAKNNAVTNYTVNDKWLIGTKVAGKAANGKTVVDISNVAINMTPTNELGAALTRTPKGNGVVELTCTATGEHKETVSVGNYVDATIPCVIQIEEEDGTITPYTSVGNRDAQLSVAAPLTITVNWKNSADIKLINATPSGLVYDINSTYVVEDDTNYVPIYLRAVEAKSTETGVDGSKVQLTVDDTLNYIKTYTATTNGNGYATFNIPVPENAVKYTVTAEFAEGGDNTTFTLEFRNATDKFMLSKDLDGSGTNYSLTFSNELGKESLANFASFATLTDKGNDVTIVSAEKDANASNKINIVTKEELSSLKNVQLIIKQNYTDANGIIHYFVDANGKLYTPAE